MFPRDKKLSSEPESDAREQLKPSNCWRDYLAAIRFRLGEVHPEVERRAVLLVFQKEAERASQRSELVDVARLKVIDFRNLHFVSAIGFHDLVSLSLDKCVVVRPMVTEVARQIEEPFSGTRGPSFLLMHQHR